MKMDLKTMIFAFVIAVSNGILLDAGTAQSTQGKLSLHEAVKTCNITEVKKFFKNNPHADINAVDNVYTGQTPIYLASCYCNEALNINIVVYLKDRGADINKTNYHDWTPLHAAAYNDTIDLAKYLVENNADIYKINYEGQTPGQTEYKFPHLGIRSTTKYLFHVKNYFENLTIVTEDDVNEQGQLINPITIPNYKKLDLLPIVVKKKLQMSLFRDERIRKKLHDSHFLFY